MKLDEIRQILDLVREHELTEFELEQGDVKIRVKKQGGAVVAVDGPALNAVTPPAAPSNPGPVAPPVAAPAAEPADEDEDLELAVVQAPIVGTFYRAADPSAPAFVNVGDLVKKNQVLCIIEAMKLMNEITSEHDGELVKVYVENGQPVQYGERLFAIRRA
jgi:acetyl-CoA carboxylase biotin carboxyl carrier protein